MTTIARFWTEWQRAHTDLEPHAVWLAASGWTVPTWSDPQLMRKLHETGGDVDTVFVQYYTASKGAKLTSLFTRLQQSSGLRRWRTLLSEAVVSYNDRRYAIVTTALLAVLEGAIAHGASHLKRWPHPKDSAVMKRTSTPAGMRRLIWTSIEAFANQLFASSPFDKKRPRVLNRHWIMHGRNTTAWSRRRECIRLFHALDTVSMTVDKVR